MYDLENCKFLCSICCESFQDEALCYRHMNNHDVISSTTIKESKETKSSHDVITTPQDIETSERVNLHNENVRKSVPANITDKCHSTLKYSPFSRELSHRKYGKGRERGFQCIYCDRVLSKPSLLNVHLRTHTNERPYRCDLCSKAFKRKTHLAQHRHLHSGVKQYKCFKCSAAYADKCNLNRHNKLYHKNSQTIQRNFRSRAARTLIVDGLALSSSQMVLNDECSKSVTDVSDDEADQYDHCGNQVNELSEPNSDDLSESKDASVSAETIEIQPSTGHYPSNTFSDGEVCSDDDIRKDFTDLISEGGTGISGNTDQSLDSANMIVCVMDDTCIIMETGEGKSSTVINVETENERSRVGDVFTRKEIRSDDQGDCTATSDDVFLPKRDVSSTDELDSGRTEGGSVVPSVSYKCNSCGKEFKSESALKYHIRKHTKEGVIKCRICKKDFFKPSLLKVHMRRHTGERPYSCSVCRKSYRDMPQLRDHMKLHSGENLFPCSECEKVFVKRSGLDVHFKTHTGNKTFQCKECLKSFTTQQHLQRHMRSHTGEKPYPCGVCHLTFGDTSNRKKHMVRHHRDKT